MSQHNSQIKVLQQTLAEQTQKHTDDLKTIRQDFSEQHQFILYKVMVFIIVLLVVYSTNPIIGYIFSSIIIGNLVYIIKILIVYSELLKSAISKSSLEAFASGLPTSGAPYWVSTKTHLSTSKLALSHAGRHRDPSLNG